MLVPAIAQSVSVAVLLTAQDRPPASPEGMGPPPPRPAVQTLSPPAPPTFSTSAPGPDQDDVQVSSPSVALQAETVLLVDPTDRNHLIAGAIDDRGSTTCAFYSSQDAGESWSELFFPLPPGFPAAADPAAAFGPGGETYFCALAYDPSYTFSTLFVGRSLDGGLSVNSWVPAVSSPPGVFEDKEFLAADQSDGPLSGVLYATWTRFSNSLTDNSIYMTSSFDKGQRWTPPRRISDSSNCQGSTVAVGPDGELYVAWLELDPPYSRGTIQFDRSLDGGLTFGTDVKVDTFNIIIGVPNASFRTYSFPSLGVDRSGGPHHGNLYLVWAARPNNPSIFLSRSTDGGLTWSSKIRVNDDGTGNAQFFPWVDVDPNGNVNVGFQDRRDDPLDRQIAYYVARSSDGGLTFQPNVRVSDQTFDPTTYPDGWFIGDYTHIAASDRSVHGIWTDGRNGTDDVFTSRVQLDFHADAELLSAATGGVVNFTVNPGPRFAGADYRVLGSLSGHDPGLDLGGGVVLPLNFDAFTLFTWTRANSVVLPGFRGSLDATGSAVAVLDSLGPFDPAFAGLTLDFATLVSSGGVALFASNFDTVTLVP